MTKEMKNPVKRLKIENKVDKTFQKVKQKDRDRK